MGTYEGMENEETISSEETSESKASLNSEDTSELATDS